MLEKSFKSSGWRNHRITAGGTLINIHYSAASEVAGTDLNLGSSALSVRGER